MTALSLVALVLFFVVVPLSIGTVYVLLEEGARGHRHVHLLNRRT